MVEGLIRRQFPVWSGLRVRPVEHGGWDNRTFHLGDRMTVRLPSGSGYVPQVEKEQRWLPWLASRLPLPIPTPIALGAPDDGYPFPWSIYGWIDGEVSSVAPIADPTAFAVDVAEFLTALRGLDASDGPLAGLHSAWRGASLTVYDGETRAAIEKLGARIPADRATELWENALAVPFDGAPVWFHGDIATGNLLVQNGRLSAVIDFGCCGVGDPACDTVIAWTRFSGESRDAFREAVRVDDATWARGRAWALWKSLITVADADAARVAEFNPTLEAVLALD